ncbi:MAG: signal peptidase I [Lachnospiraceae bacterium]
MGKEVKLASVHQLEEELSRVKRRAQRRRSLWSLIGTVLTAAAAAVLISTFWAPMIRIYGSSMSPALEEGDIVLSLKTASLERGDLVAFYCGRKVLVKRVIACPGELVELDREGNVYINGSLLDEPYVKEKAYGDVSVVFPCQVPEGKYFVMGDHRAVSADSRSVEIGCVAEELIAGKIVLRVWPLPLFWNSCQVF